LCQIGPPKKFLESGDCFFQERLAHASLLYYTQHMDCITQTSKDYELLDSGGGEKLERYGAVVLSRPDPQALWQKSKGDDAWKDVHAVFEHGKTSGKWKTLKNIPTPWHVALGGVTVDLKLSPFKHVGLFPEQSVHWVWLQDLITKKQKDVEGKKISILNLFGYTGGASIACALSGGEVTHVDASESAVKWSKINRDASGLPADAIRFIVEDARKFVEREIRRGKTYDIIILDPPAYGRGAKDELWKIEDDLIPFLARLKKLVSPKPLALLLNGYASGYSHIAYKQALADITSDLKGNIVSGELCIRESQTIRVLPCGIFARWESE